MRNAYMKESLEFDYLMQDGEISWLVFGLRIVPTKIQKLSVLNNILFNQPWALSRSIILDILQTTTNRGSQLNSNVNTKELICAVIIMIFHHKIARLVESLGIETYIERSNKKHSSSKENLNIQKQKLHSLKRYLVDIEELSLSSKDSTKSEGFLRDDFELDILQYNNKKSDQLEQFSKHLHSDYSNCSEFKIKDSKYLSPFDFNLKDEGIPILSDLIQNDYIRIFYKEIEHIREFTTNHIYYDEERIETKPFLIAVERYIEKVFGIYHEDYNYSIMNTLLDEDIKCFVKYILFTPEKLTEEKIAYLSLPLREIELFHLVLFIVNIRSRISLLYFAAALNQAMKELNY